MPALSCVSSTSAFPSARFSRASPFCARLSRASSYSARFSRASPSLANAERTPSGILLQSAHQSSSRGGRSLSFPNIFFWGGYIPVILVAIVAMLGTVVRATMAQPPWPSKLHAPPWPSWLPEPPVLPWPPSACPV